MNKRIQELMEQAFEEIQVEDELYHFEKFAELIIKECTYKMEECFAGGSQSEDKKELWETLEGFKAWNGAIKFSRDKIKQHFGMEK